jgi:ABC-type nickel/cobalt efflux system permease component RcnA
MMAARNTYLKSLEHSYELSKGFFEKQSDLLVQLLAAVSRTQEMRQEMMQKTDVKEQMPDEKEQLKKQLEKTSMPREDNVLLIADKIEILPENDHKEDTE